MDEFAVFASAALTSEAQVALLWWDRGIMDELAVLFLAVNAIIAVLWSVASTFWWLAFMAELAVLTGAVLTVVADLLTAWWSGWAIVAELAVFTSAVLTSVALAGAAAATESLWCSVMGELAVLAGAVLAIVADLLGSTETATWSLIATFVGESAVLAGAVLTIVADLLGTAETTAWSFVTALWVWTVGETAVLSLAVLAFVAVLLATGWATSTFTTRWGLTIMGELAVWSGAVLTVITFTAWYSFLFVVFKSASLLGAVSVAVANSAASTLLHSLPCSIQKIGRAHV